MPEPMVIDDAKTRAVRVLLSHEWQENEIAAATGLPRKRIGQIRDALARVVVLTEREAALRLEARVLLKVRNWSDEAIDLATDIRNRGMVGRMTKARRHYTRRAIIELRVHGWSHQTIADALLLSRQTVSAHLNADAEREEREAR